MRRVLKVALDALNAAEVRDTVGLAGNDERGGGDGSDFVP